MIARALDYLTSFLRPWRGRANARPDVALCGVEELLREYESLAADRQLEVAGALAQLWDAVVEHFGGIEGFLTGDAGRRDDYIRRLETAARRMRKAVGSEKGHYYFATAMLAHYLQALNEGLDEGDDQRIAGIVVALVDRGRTLAPAPTELAEAHVTTA